MKRMLAVIPLILGLAMGSTQSFPDAIKSVPNNIAPPKLSSAGSNVGAQQPPAPALQFAADTWSWVGNALQSSCRAVQGQTMDLSRLLGVNFPVKVPVQVTWQPELAWVCEAAKTWAFIHNVLNEDWAQMAGDITGQWIGDVVTGTITMMGIEVGSAAWENEIAQLNDALKRGYRSFMSQLRNYVWREVSASLDKARQEKATARTSTLNTNNQIAQNLALKEQKIRELVPTVHAVAADQYVAAQYKNEGGTITTLKKERETIFLAGQEPVKTIQNQHSLYFGQAGAPGELQKTLDESRQAPDTRTAIEVLTKMTGHVLSAELYGSKAIVDVLYQILTHQHFSNQILEGQLRQAGLQATLIEEAARDSIENLAADAMISQFATDATGEAVIQIVQSAVGQTPASTEGF